MPTRTTAREQNQTPVFGNFGKPPKPPDLTPLATSSKWLFLRFCYEHHLKVSTVAEVLPSRTLSRPLVTPNVAEPLSQDATVSNGNDDVPTIADSLAAGLVSGFSWRAMLFIIIPVSQKQQNASYVGVTMATSSVRGVLVGHGVHTSRKEALQMAHCVAACNVETWAPEWCYDWRRRQHLGVGAVANVPVTGDGAFRGDDFVDFPKVTFWEQATLNPKDGLEDNGGLETEQSRGDRALNNVLSLIKQLNKKGLGEEMLLSSSALGVVPPREFIPVPCTLRNSEQLHLAHQRLAETSTAAALDSLRKSVLSLSNIPPGRRPPPQTALGTGVGSVPASVLGTSTYDPRSDSIMKKQLREWMQSTHGKQILTGRQRIPVWEKLVWGDLEDEVEPMLIRAEPGSGVTSQLPQLTLEHYIEHGSGTKCNILVCLPDESQAVHAALRVARERSLSRNGDEFGRSVGLFLTAFDVRPCLMGGTITFATSEAILECLAAPSSGTAPGGFLAPFSHIIVDELQEHNAYSDVLFTFLKDTPPPSLADFRLIGTKALLPKVLRGKLWPEDGSEGEGEGEDDYDDIDTYVLESDSEEGGEDETEGRREAENDTPSSYRSWQKPAIVAWRAITTELQDALNGPQNTKMSDRLKEALVASNSEHVVPVEIIAHIIAYIHYQDSLLAHRPESTSHILVFLPSSSEIAEVLHILTSTRLLGHNFADPDRFALIPICEYTSITTAVSSSPSLGELNDTTKHPEKRRIVLATDVVARRMSIPNVGYVVDSGRVLRRCLSERKAEENDVEDDGIEIGMGVGHVSGSYYMRSCWADRETQGFRMSCVGRGHDTVLDDVLTKGRYWVCCDESRVLFLDLDPQYMEGFGDEDPEETLLRNVDEAVDELCEMGVLHKPTRSSEISETPIGNLVSRLPLPPRTAKLLVTGVLMRMLDPCLTIAAGALTTRMTRLGSVLSPRVEHNNANKYGNHDVAVAAAAESGANSISLFYQEDSLLDIASCLLPSTSDGHSPLSTSSYSDESSAWVPKFLDQFNNWRQIRSDWFVRHLGRTSAFHIGGVTVASLLPMFFGLDAQFAGKGVEILKAEEVKEVAELQQDLVQMSFRTSTHDAGYGDAFAFIMVERFRDTLYRMLKTSGVIEHEAVLMQPWSVLGGSRYNRIHSSSTETQGLDCLYPQWASLMLCFAMLPRVAQAQTYISGHQGRSNQRSASGPQPNRRTFFVVARRNSETRVQSTNPVFGFEPHKTHTDFSRWRVSDEEASDGELARLCSMVPIDEGLLATKPTDATQFRPQIYVYDRISTTDKGAVALGLMKMSPMLVWISQKLAGGLLAGTTGTNGNGSTVPITSTTSSTTVIEKGEGVLSVNGLRIIPHVQNDLEGVPSNSTVPLQVLFEACHHYQTLLLHRALQTEFPPATFDDSHISALLHGMVDGDGVPGTTTSPEIGTVVEQLMDTVLMAVGDVDVNSNEVALRQLPTAAEEGKGKAKASYASLLRVRSSSNTKVESPPVVTSESSIAIAPTHTIMDTLTNPDDYSLAVQLELLHSQMVEQQRQRDQATDAWILDGMVADDNRFDGYIADLDSDHEGEYIPLESGYASSLSASTSSSTIPKRNPPEIRRVGEMVGRGEIPKNNYYGVLDDVDRL
ncbi:hypothetical protein HK102_002252 [Quaeritorhiza haematococci]|nr:hypothetical protein HK102_002252 [Quaeritorhiza haematococci]